MIFAPVEAIRVYRNSAVVRRKAAVRLQSGTNEVILSGVSPSADPDSLRLFFPSGVVGRDVQILPFAEAVPQLPSAQLEDEIAELQSRISTLKTMEELWIANGNFQTRGECSHETVEGYLEALPAHLEELRARKRELVRQIEELQEKKEALAKKEVFSAVRLILEVPEACEVACEMEYAENAAGWNSTYEIHTAADAREIRVLRRARITQNTGEDWEKVQIALFTGNPTAQQEIPTLGKQTLQFKPEVKPAAQPLMARAAAPTGAPGMMMGMAMPMAAPLKQLAAEEAEETDADTMTCYSLPGKYTVVSGTVGGMADLKTTVIPAEIRIVCVPKLDDRAFLAAIIKTADWPLKPSSAKIYLNDNYCGAVRVDPDMTKETFLLSLGVDERVRPSRETIVSKTEDVLLKGQKRKLSEYAIRIANRQAQPLTVLVYDQIPVSSEKQITVDHVAADGGSVNEETGKITWTLTIEGNSSVEKRLSYTVSYPKDKEILEQRSGSSRAVKRCSKCGFSTSLKFCPQCGNIM